MPDRYDIVIIGAGLGGLECGYILSKMGYSVCILEKQARIGGCLQSYQRGGIILDSGFHYVGGLAPGQPLYQIFDRFGLMSLPWHRLDADGFDEVIFGDRSYMFHNGYENFAESFAQTFPRQRRNMKEYVSLLKKVGDGTFDRLRPKGAAELSSESLFSRGAWRFLEETITDPLLRNVLSGTSYKMELSKETLPLYVFAQINSSFVQSAWRLQGGGSQVADSLAESIIRMGGRIICRAEIEELGEKDGVLTEAILNGGWHIFGSKFISDIHPAATLSLIKNSRRVRPIYRKRIDALRNTAGTFTVSLLLRPGTVPYLNRNLYIYECPDVWEPAPAGVTDRAMVSYPVPSDEKYAECMDILAPVSWVEVSRWDGSSVGRRGDEYLEYKSRKAEALIDLVCRHTSLKREHIDRIHTSSPLTWNSYTGSPEGSSYGIIKDWHDPLRTILTPETPVHNLYLTGQNLNLHGILGVSMTSFITCSAVTGQYISPIDFRILREPLA